MLVRCSGKKMFGNVHSISLAFTLKMRMKLLIKKKKKSLETIFFSLNYSLEFSSWMMINDHIIHWWHQLMRGNFGWRTSSHYVWQMFSQMHIVDTKAHTHTHKLKNTKELNAMNFFFSSSIVLIRFFFRLMFACDQ